MSKLLPKEFMTSINSMLLSTIHWIQNCIFSSVLWN